MKYAKINWGAIKKQTKQKTGDHQFVNNIFISWESSDSAGNEQNLLCNFGVPSLGAQPQLVYHIYYVIIR